MRKVLTKEHIFYIMRGNHICSTMAWEQRNNNNYYYRKVRKGSKVSSVYLCKDILTYDLSGKAYKQKLLNQKQSAQITNEEGIDQTLEENHHLIIAIAESTLLLNGFHLHKGMWRRKYGH